MKRHKKLLNGKRRTAQMNRSLSISLAFIAGAINAGGFLVVHQYTSHMTGIISVAADSIVLGQWYSAAAMLLYIVSFICGAATTALLVNWAKKYHLHSRYALPMTLEASLLLIFGIVNTDVSYIIALLCFLMGLQNAVITKISDMSIRTTHITGTATDVGIEIGRMLYAGKYADYDKGKISLHLSIIAMFLIGGITGAYGFKYIGFSTVIPLAIYLLFLAFIPIKRDFRIYSRLRRRVRKSV
jgi:uncharacterized membrane protein YoaK (UPF0700 family)